MTAISGERRKIWSEDSANCKTVEPNQVADDGAIPNEDEPFNRMK